ncbi:MAG: dehydrogenase [Muribaculaceae bacterium]|nr:dehydrogenase [Muribaculaceae bacterium]HAP50480.1 dehydrogenase [Porphyromonadaceae bacterium]
MADNFLEKQRQDFEAAKARKEQERRRRLQRFAEQYRKRKAASGHKQEHQ